MSSIAEQRETFGEETAGNFGNQVKARQCRNLQLVHKATERQGYKIGIYRVNKDKR